MTLPIIIRKDITLGEAHAGMRSCVEAGVTITLPHEDTYKSIAGDEWEIISGTEDNVNIVGDDNVTVIPLSSATITAKGGSVKVQYQGDNTYLMWSNV